MGPTIEATMTRAELLANYLRDLPNGGLFIRTDNYFGLGDRIRLSLRMEGIGTPVVAWGIVVWHRRPRAWSSSLPSGIGFEFDEGASGTRDFLLQYAAGEAVDRRQGRARSLQECAAKLKVGDTWVSATSRNAGPGGIALETDTEVAEGDNLQCLIYTDSAPQPFDCNVIVERVTREGDHFVVGARFQRTTPALRRTLSLPPEPENRIQKKFASFRPGEKRHTPTITPAPFHPTRTTLPQKH